MTQPSFSCPRCGYETFAFFGTIGACPFCSPEPTRAEVEADWFGEAATRIAAELHDDLGLGDDVEVVWDDRPMLPVHAPMPSWWGPPVGGAPGYDEIAPGAFEPHPTFRVARFVQALRRLRSR